MKLKFYFHPLFTLDDSILQHMYKRIEKLLIIITVTFSSKL